MTIDDLGLKRGFLKKWIVRVGISKVIAMRSKIVPGRFCYFFSAVWLNLCNNSDQTLFSNALTFARSLGSCLKPRPSASVSTSLSTKPCLIPILKQSVAEHWALSWHPKLISGIF